MPSLGPGRGSDGLSNLAHTAVLSRASNNPSVLQSRRRPPGDGVVQEGVEAGHHQGVTVQPQHAAVLGHVPHQQLAVGPREVAV